MASGVSTVANNVISQYAFTPAGGTQTPPLAVIDPSQLSYSPTYVTINGRTVAVSGDAAGTTGAAAFAANNVQYTVNASVASNGVDANFTITTSTGQSASGVLPYGATWAGIYASRASFGMLAYDPVMVSDAPDLILAGTAAGAMRAAATMVAGVIILGIGVGTLDAPVTVVGFLTAFAGAADLWDQLQY